mgnify:CR=1 FL=1
MALNSIEIKVLVVWVLAQYAKMSRMVPANNKTPKFATFIKHSVTIYKGTVPSLF